MIRTLLATVLLVASSGAIAMDGHEHAGATDAAGERVGTEYMVFETGVTGEAHEQFLRGLALLHNFEYRRAAAAFRKAQTADPDWAMPYWGEAMTHNHPLWEYQDREAARAALAKLDATREGRLSKTRSAREAAWLDAAETLYGDGGTKEERDHLYLAKMRALLEADPTDIDARAFTGLAVLGTSHGGRDIALYMEAAGVLEPGFMTHAMHPGILHYLIHSYDDPVHAPLGERMAERYAGVAPDAGHAQHMISHIYHALGQWEASQEANVKAVAAANAARGTAYHCGHYNEWLVYALVQQGKDASANVEACREQAGQELAASKRPPTSIAQRSAATSFARIALYSGVTSGDWVEGFDWPEDQFRRAQFHMANARLLQARDDAQTAAKALAEMKRVHAGILAALPAEYPDETGLQAWNARGIAQGEAIVKLASGDTEEGLAALRAAAEAESALPVVFGPPVMAKPSWELLGEELLALGRKQEAAEAFRAALAFAPNRKLSNEGLAAATVG
ncbi:MAG: hypothetical protein QNI87_00420 [Erythrobacter sp.]|uniref:hypothetical protein n=1 Tax=Erythrobacter sp. TaxID=1042 RepID=UPI002634B853|nr:hypothetical protein [Erythrobacter sp.]MDJ0976980.1 hypothetical protein [Erythrobacter sp.]